MAGQPDHAALMALLEENQRQLGAGDKRMATIEEALAAIQQSLACLPDMQRDIAATKGVVETWDTVQAAGRVATWMGKRIVGLSALIVAVAAVLATIKTTLAHILKG